MILDKPERITTWNPLPITRGIPEPKNERCKSPKALLRLRLGSWDHGTRSPPLRDSRHQQENGFESHGGTNFPNNIARTNVMEKQRGLTKKTENM